MATVCIVFESKYGQTEKIAEHIGDRAAERGHSVKLVRASVVDHELTEYDAFVVAAPVYYNRHHEDVDAFVRRQARVLSLRPTMFVSVSGSAGGDDPEERAGAERLARDFAAKAGLRAHTIAIAGGAMAYPRYGFFMRLALQAMSRLRGGPTDTSRVHEATDWDALDAVTARFLDALPDEHISLADLLYAET